MSYNLYKHEACTNKFLAILFYKPYTYYTLLQIHLNILHLIQIYSFYEYISSYLILQSLHLLQPTTNTSQCPTTYTNIACTSIFLAILFYKAYTYYNLLQIHLNILHLIQTYSLYNYNSSYFILQSLHLLHSTTNTSQYNIILYPGIPNTKTAYENIAKKCGQIEL